jgi:hypothetical protein
VFRVVLRVGSAVLGADFCAHQGFPMSIQIDVLDAIGPDGIEKSLLREKVGNVGQSELDVAVNALMRAGRLRSSFGRYEIIPSKRPLGDMRGGPKSALAPADLAGLPPTLISQLSPQAQKIVSQQPTAVSAESTPTAEEEAAANLQPASRTCDRCGETKVLNADNFSRNRHGFMLICKRCYGLAVSAGGKGKIIPVAGQSDSHKLVHADPENGPATFQNQVASVENTQVNGSSGVEGHACDGSPSLTGPRTSGNRFSPAASSATPGAKLTGEGSQPPAGEPSRPRELRLDPDGVYERAKAMRQGALNHIAILEVDIANQRSKVAECDRFLEMWERFAND